MNNMIDVKPRFTDRIAGFIYNCRKFASDPFTLLTVMATGYVTSDLFKNLIKHGVSSKQLSNVLLK